MLFSRIKFRQKYERGSVPSSIGFLTGIIAVFLPLSATGSECDRLSYSGMCEDSIHIWCEYGEIQKLDCSSLGMVCDWDDSNGYFGCIPSDEQLSLCELPPTGLCDFEENSVSWCTDEGDVESLLCQEGMVCGWNTDEEYMDCIPEQEGAPWSEEDRIPEPNESETDGEEESRRVETGQETTTEASDPAESVERMGQSIPLYQEPEEPQSEQKTDEVETDLESEIGPDLPHAEAVGCKASNGTTSVPLALVFLFCATVLVSARRSTPLQR